MACLHGPWDSPLVRRTVLPSIFACCLVMGALLSPPARAAQDAVHPGKDRPVSLPSIKMFAKKKSNVLPVDISRSVGTAPFLGARAASPHQGIHVYWSNQDGQWPTAPGQPSDYPAVYAVSDGIVGNVETLRQMGSHQAYGLVLQIAEDGRSPSSVVYSLEPFVNEPSPGYYRQFIKVRNGQRVKKGQLLGYMYVPATSDGSTHMHFHLSTGSVIKSPSIFSSEVVQQLAAKFGDRGGTENGLVLPACIGYKISAAENPFGAGAADCLN